MGASSPGFRGRARTKDVPLPPGQDLTEGGARSTWSWTDLMALDSTAAARGCVHRGDLGVVAALRGYSGAPGPVARCPGCNGVVLRLVRGSDCPWLDLTGLTSMRIPLDP